MADRRQLVQVVVSGIAETTGGPIGRRPAAVTFGMNTENKVPAWVTSRHLRRSILIRWAYQSCWLAWPMAGSDTPSSVNTLAVHRSITSHDRRQSHRRSVGKNAVAVRRYSVAACWSLIWVTSSTCRTTLRVPRGASRSIWAILSGRAPPARLAIRGCLRCRVGADRPTGAALGG